MSKRAEQGRETRGQFVTLARDLFAEHGYEGTSIDAVLQAAGVSKGALYHHFKGKEALFEAVFEAVEEDIGLRLAACAPPDSTPEQFLRAASLAWVHMAVEPVVRRVVLIDAPAVLGWFRWREIEEQHGLGAMKELLRASGLFDAELSDSVAHMLFAALSEAALQIASADDPVAQAIVAEAAVAVLLDRVLG